VTNRVSNLGDGVSVAKDIIIYDVPITEVIVSRKEHTAFFDLVRVKLPSTVEDLENISVYAFAYDIRVPKLLDQNLRTISQSTLVLQLFHLQLLWGTKLYSCHLLLKTHLLG
jgi:hypothetical protein